MADLDGTTFLGGANPGFIAELYARFLEDPDAIDDSCRSFFADLGDDGSAVLAELRAPSWGHSAPRIVTDGAAAAAGTKVEELRQATIDSIRGLNLIRAYRVRGHLEAELDPLELD